MTVRTPFEPCSMASHSSSRSQTCQNGVDHLPPTSAKSMECTPRPVMRFTNRCPKTRTSSTTPEARMNIQPYSS